MSQAAIARPVVMSAAMAAATLEGRKSTFREAVTPQPINAYVRMVSGADLGEPYLWAPANCHVEYIQQGLPIPLWECPYGVPGDRLYVQEPWNKHGGAVSYLADGDWIADWLKDSKTPIPAWAVPQWQDADSMPEEHARLVLEIVSVQAKHLQEINAEQAKAEGMFFDTRAKKYVITEGDEYKGRGTADAREAFFMLWESMRTGYMWVSNPWVWVVEFKVVNHGL